MARYQLKGTELNVRQKLFCYYYVETGNATESAIKAGYKPKAAQANASRLLSYELVKQEIARLQKPIEDHHIATGQEVMEFFTKMMNGEIKDAFGLDASNSDRLKAANEIAKRTVDIENKMAGKEDTTVHISLDWGRKSGTS